MKKLALCLAILLILQLFLPALPAPAPLAVAAGSSRFLAAIEPPAPGSVPIATRAQLEAIQENLGGTYHLVSDIDLSGAEWTPIGTVHERFTGIFDGQGHILRGLTIKEVPILPSTLPIAGLFGFISGAAVKNVGLEDTNINIASDETLASVGGIVGIINDGILRNCYVTGNISAVNSMRVGGIAGALVHNYLCRIEYSFNEANVSSVILRDNLFMHSFAGGIVGVFHGGADPNDTSIEINKTYNAGKISASYHVAVGGIAGAGQGVIRNSFNVGNLHGGFVSGIAGESHALGLSLYIYNCYNAGNLHANIPWPSVFTIAGISLGAENLAASNTFWNIEREQTINGVALDASEKRGLRQWVSGDDPTTPLTTAQMRQQSSFVGFDFETIWDIDPAVNDGFPFFRTPCGTPSPTPTASPTPTPAPTAPPDHDHTGCCIDYSHPDLIVPGSADGFSINLTRETLTLPGGYTPVAFSIDGGTRWRAVRNDALGAARFPRLLNRGMTLHLSDRPVDRRTRRPEEGAVTVSFPRINRRARPPRLTINYAIASDPTGNTPGQWVLTERGGTSAVKDSVQIGVAAPETRFRTVDSYGFGHFFPGPSNGICVKPLTGTRVTRTAYFFRTAPTQNGDQFTAASRPRRIRATSEQRRARFRVRGRTARLNRDGSVRTPATAAIRLRPNTFVSINGEPPVLYLHNTTLNVLEISGTVTLWQAATPRRAAGARQVLTAG